MGEQTVISSARIQRVLDLLEVMSDLMKPDEAKGVKFTVSMIRKEITQREKSAKKNEVHTKPKQTIYISRLEWILNLLEVMSDLMEPAKAKGVKLAVSMIHKEINEKEE